MIARGWAATTPAAIVAGAGTHAQRLWFGDVAALLETDFDPIGAPVTLVIGETVALADRINRPLPVDDPQPQTQPAHMRT